MENNETTRNPQNPQSQEEPSRVHQQTGSTGNYRQDPTMPPKPGRIDVPEDLDEPPTGGTGGGREGIGYPENPNPRPPQPGDYQAPAGNRNWSEEQGDQPGQNPQDRNRDPREREDQNRPQGGWGDRPDNEQNDDEPVQPRD